MNAIFEALALPWHAARILAFRHDGKGLPARYNFDLLTIAALSLSVGELRWSLVPGGNPLETAGQYILCLAVTALVMLPARFTLIALAYVGTDLAAVALTYAGVDCSEGWICDSLMVWCTLASIVADRTVRKHRATTAR